MRISHFRPAKGLGYHPITNGVKDQFESVDPSISGLFEVGGTVFVFAKNASTHEWSVGKYMPQGIVTIRGDAAKKLFESYANKWPLEE